MFTESINTMLLLHFELKNAESRNFLKSQLLDWKDLTEEVLLLFILTGTFTIVTSFLSFLTSSVTLVASSSSIHILHGHAG
jgi:hypothetical protein